jgi:hypothetical protein
MKQKQLLAVLLFVSLSCAAQTPTLYDNFNHKFLSPSRWAYAICYAGNGLELECVREIQDEQLHLAHRSFGQTDSNTGLQGGAALVGFANSASIKSIRMDLIVRNVLESPCAANPGFGGSANIWGVFFNAGSGDSTDDVGAQLVFGRLASDPPGQLNVHGQTFHGGSYSPFVPLGTVWIGTPVTATLTWDQPNHRFVVSWINKITHTTMRGMMPYSFSDTTPAAGAAKVLEVSGFPANCTANPTSVYVDALFDNVYVSQ